MLLLLRFFQNPKKRNFLRFLLCFIRFLELCLPTPTNNEARGAAGRHTTAPNQPQQAFVPTPVARKLPLTASIRGRETRLSWPGWLVTYTKPHPSKY